jgi:hypothetical protein
VFGVVLRPMAAILDYNNVYYQNLELPLMVVNVFVEIALPIEMGIDVRSYAEKEKTLFVLLCRLWYLCGRVS